MIAERACILTYSVFRDLWKDLRAVHPSDSVRVNRSALRYNKSFLFNVRAAPGFSATPNRSRVRSAGNESRVFTDAPLNIFRQESCLHLQHSTVTDTVAEQGMGHQCVHAQLVGTVKVLSPGGR